MRILTLLGIVLFWGFLAQAQEIEEAENKKIMMEVQKEVDGRIRDIVTPLLIAEKLKMPFPPVAPTRKVEDIKKEVKQKVIESVNDKFPLSEKDKKMADALKKYHLYKKGDNVPSLQVKAAGRAAIVKGEFKGFNRKGELLVGGTTVPKVDMSEKVMVHFDPVLNKKKIDTYVKNKLFYFYEDRAKMTKDLTPVMEKDLFGKAGYYIESGKFLPADEYLKKQYSMEKDNVANKLKPVVEKEIYGKYGYVKSENTWVKMDVNEEVALESTDDKSNETEVSDPLAEDEPAEIEKREKKPLFDPQFYDPDF